MIACGTSSLYHTVRIISVSVFVLLKTNQALGKYFQVI